MLKIRSANLVSRAVIGAIAASLATQPASAQTSGAPAQSEASATSWDLSEVVVTATRRPERLQDTPIAVSSFSAEQLSQKGVLNAIDLAGRVPNLIAPNRTSSNSMGTYSIRGVGEPDFRQDPSVGVYVDDVYIPRAIASAADIPDLERVEVLRGPQGTYYGRNTSAGLIRFITRDPDEPSQAKADLRVGNYSAVDFRGSANGAIVADKLYGSISYLNRRRDGYMHSVTLDRDANDLDVQTARAKLKYFASDAVSITLAGNALWDRSSASWYPPVYQPNGNNGVPTSQYSPYTTWASAYPTQYSRSYGGSATVAWQISDRQSIRSTTAYSDLKTDLNTINDGGTSLHVNSSLRKFRNRQFSQEINYTLTTDPLTIAAGLYYLHEYFAFDQAALVGRPTPGQYRTTYIFPIQKTNSYAGYLQAEYSLTSELSVSVGGRYTHDDRPYQTSGFTVTGPLTPNAPNLIGIENLVRDAGSSFSTKASYSAGEFTPQAKIQYRWAPNLMTYASFAQGFKSGGYDVGASSLVNASAPVKSESVDSYEIGLKSEMFDRRLRVNLAAFTTQYRDYQISAIDPATQLRLRLNAASARMKGVELELSAAPTDRLTFDIAAGYLDAKFTAFNATLPSNSEGITTLVGRSLPFAPKWSGSFGSSYRLPVASGEMTFSGDVVYNSHAFTDVYNTRQVNLDEQATVNGSVVYTFDENPWRVGVYVTNLFNNSKSQDGSYSTGTGPFGTYTRVPHMPRVVTFGVGATF